MPPAANLLSFHRSVLPKALGARWHGTGLLGRNYIEHEIAMCHSVGILHAHAPDTVLPHAGITARRPVVCCRPGLPRANRDIVKPLGPWAREFNVLR